MTTPRPYRWGRGVWSWGSSWTQRKNRLPHLPDPMKRVLCCWGHLETWVCTAPHHCLQNCTSQRLPRIQPPPLICLMEMNTLLFTVVFFIFPLLAFTGWLCYILWYILNTNLGISIGLSWQERVLISLDIQNSTPDWKVLGMLARHKRTLFFLLLGQAILTKRPTSSQ